MLYGLDHYSAQSAKGQLPQGSGFFSISSFNRTFKGKMGMSPRDWRKQHGAEGSSNRHEKR